MSLVVGPTLVGAARQPDEKEIFPSGPEPTPIVAPLRPAVTYWRATLGLTLGPSEPGSWLRLTLPLSDGRQAVLQRKLGAEGFRAEEGFEGGNLVAALTRLNGSETASLDAEFLVRIAEIRFEPPRSPFPPQALPPEVAEFLRPSASIQSDAAPIRERASEIVRSATRLDEAAWALFQYTASFLKTDPDPQKLDALGVLREQRGSVAGKARLLTALLRAAGIPARMVGGLRLTDASRTRSTISWVEAWLDGVWFPMDAAGGNFGVVPGNYLTLYRGDVPLIVHRTGLDLQYEFRVRQVTRKSAAEGEPAGAPQPVVKASEPIEIETENDRVRTVASYLPNAVATVVILTDEEVPEALVERIRGEANKSLINLVILSAQFQSRYFRESTLERMAERNLHAIREAHVLLVSSRDEAGLYSLLGLGDGQLRLNDARIVVAGSFFRPVGTVLGNAVYALFDPGELALFPRRTDLSSLWEVARSNLIDGKPILDESREWGMEPTVIDDTSFESLTWYRREIVRGWVRAVRARVPLQALNLILVLPIIAFLVVVCRNFIGLDTFGTFSPVLVSLAFLTTGLWWGAVIFVVIVGLGAILRSALQRLRLHLVARLAILIGLVSAVMTGLTIFGAYLGIGALLQVSLFPMVIMSNLIENFTASQIEFGTREAIRLTANTLLVCVLCYGAVEWMGLPSILLAFPEILILVLALEVLLGKWRGLRILELRRFYELLRRAGRGSPEVNPP